MKNDMMTIATPSRPSFGSFRQDRILLLYVVIGERPSPCSLTTAPGFEDYEKCVLAHTIERRCAKMCACVRDRK